MDALSLPACSLCSYSQKSGMQAAVEGLIVDKGQVSKSKGCAAMISKSVIRFKYSRLARTGYESHT